MIMDFVREQLATNQFFQGAGLVAVMAALWGWVRGWPRIIWHWTIYHTTVLVEIPNGDPAFEWIEAWLANHQYTRRTARRITASTRRRAGIYDDDDQTRETMLTLAPGNHYVWEGWFKFMVIKRERNTNVEAGGYTGGHGGRKKFFESFTVRMLGRNRQRALDLIEEAKKVAQAQQDKNLITIRKIKYDRWDILTKRSGRDIDTVIMDDFALEGLVEDMSWFFRHYDWYRVRGIPYRRGYLFHGQPGNGKSSLIAALATHFNQDIGFMSLREMNDDEVMDAFADVPANMFLVVEDVDAIFTDRDSEANLSFSGFINGLDGIASSEGRIVIMTTNYRDKLDPAMLRPGRVDREVVFSNASDEQKRRMFARFYPGEDETLARDFAAAACDASMAAVQGHLIKYHSDARAAISNSSTIGQ